MNLGDPAKKACRKMLRVPDIMESWDFVGELDLVSSRRVNAKLAEMILGRETAMMDVKSGGRKVYHRMVRALIYTIFNDLISCLNFEYRR